MIVAVARHADADPGHAQPARRPDRLAAPPQVRRRRPSPRRPRTTTRRSTAASGAAITRVVMAPPGRQRSSSPSACCSPLALPYLDLKTGQAGVESLPDSDVKTGYEILQRGLLRRRPRAGRDRRRRRRERPAVAGGRRRPRRRRSATTRCTARPTIADRTTAGDLALVAVPLTIDADSPDAVRRDRRPARRRSIPAAFGERRRRCLRHRRRRPSTRDFNAAIDDYTPIVFAFVLGLSFLLLMLAFRSIVVPLKAI